MLVIVVMGAATVLVGSLSTTRMQTARQETTAAALAQAKEALIGYATADSNRPGELPCPDVNGDGMLTMGVDYNSGTPPSCISFIGYLPWKTLGLQELRDGNNAKLWYALSTNFYAGNSTPLNSDTQGQLSIAGNISLSNVAAIVFAPGEPLCGKSHNSNNVSDFLEAGDGTTTIYALKPFSDDCNNSPYNDNLVAITASQVFQHVEKRVGSEIRQILKTYYSAWGAFPYAAPFADPSTSSFTGQASPANYEGLLPIGNSIIPTWLAIPTVTLSGSTCNTGTTPSCTCTLRPTGCTTNCTYWRCNFGGITGTPTIRIVGTLNSVGTGLWRPYDPSAGSSTSREVGVRISGNSYSTSAYDAAATVMNNTSVSGILNTDGSATITFLGTVQLGIIPSRIQLLTTGIPFYTTPASSPVIPSWISSNNWHQVAYYSVSPGYAPGGGNFCNPLPGTPSCLTLSGSGGGNNKRAAVVMTGSALSGQAHPQSTIGNYLEGENLSPADYIYENKTQSGTFNDQIISVAP